MQILKPSYYDKFICTGSLCHETCCKDWHIALDQPTYIRYEKETGPFGEKLRTIIKKNKSPNASCEVFGTIQLTKGICPFLSPNQLCDIYLHLGEAAMCSVCKTFPRSTTHYLNHTEKVMSFACPEVVRILLNDNNPLSFDIEELNADLSSNKSPSYNPEFFNFLWEIRLLFINIAQFRELPIYKRLLFIQMGADVAQSSIDNHQFSSTSWIGKLTQMVESEHTTNKLGHLTPQIATKINLLCDCIQQRCNETAPSATFGALIHDFNTLLEETKQAKTFHFLRALEEEFNSYFAPREYILEHYIVNHLYTHILHTLNISDLNFQIFKLFLGYSIIKSLLLARWKISHKSLSTEDILDVFSSFARTFVHADKISYEIYISFKKQGCYDMQHLASLIL